MSRGEVVTRKEQKDKTDGVKNVIQHTESFIGIIIISGDPEEEMQIQVATTEEAE